jgi:hypothetical protein
VNNLENVARNRKLPQRDILKPCIVDLNMSRVSNQVLTALVSSLFLKIMLSF